MPSQYHLQQRTASALSEICGINDIVETGSNANGWYCKFANGLQVMLMTDQQYFEGSSTITKNVTTPTTSLASTGNGTAHTETQPGSAVYISNFLIIPNGIRVTYYPLGSWGGYDRTLTFIVVGRWR